MGIVFEENAPEYGGLYVAELAAGGAAAVTGLVLPEDQLVAVGGASVTGTAFEAVMDALGAAPSPATLRLFRGTAAELAAADAKTMGATPAPAASAARPDATTITVVQEGAAGPTITVKGDPLLRNVLLENKVELYGGMAKLTNCGGTGQCGTCMVDVVGSEDGTAGGAFSARTETETRRLKKRAGSVRLACQVVVQGGDATVKTKP